MSEAISFEKRGGAAWLTLQRPDKLNALDAGMRETLLDYFSGLRRDPTTRVVVLRGKGRGFCAGLDLDTANAEAPGFRPEPEGREHFASHEALAYQQSWSELALRMRACPQPIIALLHGPTSGLGFSIALASDVRIAADTVRMNAAFLRIGLTGGDCASSYHLPRLVGGSVASELLLTGRFIDAPRALRTGLVSDVVPEDELEAAGEAMARDMLRNAPLGLRLTKELLNASQGATTLAEQVALEDRSQVVALSSGDPGEGSRAFLEKRDPDYAP
jgi:enoyl-CoA hydratase